MRHRWTRMHTLLAGIAGAAALLLSSCSVEWHRSETRGGATISLPTEFGPWSFHDEAQRNDERVLDLAGIGEVRLTTKSGEVRVLGGATSSCILASVRAVGRSQEEAQQLLDRFVLEVTQVGSRIEIALDGEPLRVEDGDLWIDLMPEVHLELHLADTVAVHATTLSGNVAVEGPVGDLVVESGYGAAEVAQVEGSLRVELDSGAATVRDVRGGEVEVSSQYGALHLERLHATQLEATTQSGEIRAKDLQAELLTLSSGYGELELENVRGDVRAKSASGNITWRNGVGDRHVVHSDYGVLALEDVRGDLDLVTQSGNIEVSGASGSLGAESGYGALDLRGVFDRVVARSASGEVAVVAEAGSELATDWTVESQYGSLRATLPHELHCDVDLKTDYGKLRWEYRITVDPGSAENERALRGTIGNGGPKLTLHTASGDVELLCADR